MGWVRRGGGGGGGVCKWCAEQSFTSPPALLHQHSLTQGMVVDKVKQTEYGTAHCMRVLMCASVSVCIMCVVVRLGLSVALTHYVEMCCNDVQWDSFPPSLSLCVYMCVMPKEKSYAQLCTCMQHALECTQAHGTNTLFKLTQTHTHRKKAAACCTVPGLTK